MILVGTPRGNRVIRELVPEGPLSWDDRTVRAEGLSYHRSLRPGVAVTMSYPGDPTRSLMILDGRPAWSEPSGALPFSSIKDRSWLLIPPRP